MRQRRVAGVEDAGQVRVDDLGPLLRRHVGDVGEDADAGVVDEDVEAAEARDGRGDRALRPRRSGERRPAASRRRPGRRPRSSAARPTDARALRPVTATCTPSATSARAIARPMPREPPVTSATFPRSDCIAITISQRMQDVAIIGAGELGGAVAHVLARRDLVRSITLIDETGASPPARRSTSRRRRRSKASRRGCPARTDVSMAAGARS